MTNKRSKARSLLPSLSPLELQIMDIVWELGDCTSAQVTKAFKSRRPLAPTTIRTVLANLRKKGYLKPIPAVSRGFVLRATVARETVARRSMKEMLSSFFQGSPCQAISYLIDEADLTDRDFEEIRELIDKYTDARHTS